MVCFHFSLGVDCVGLMACSGDVLPVTSAANSRGIRCDVALGSGMAAQMRHVARYNNKSTNFRSVLAAGSIEEDAALQGKEGKVCKCITGQQSRWWCQSKIN